MILNNNKIKYLSNVKKIISDFVSGNEYEISREWMLLHRGSTEQKV